jgi:solute carrier family 35 protein C2
MFDPDRLNFKFPLFTTSAHMLIQFTLSLVVLYFAPSLRPQHKHNSDLGRSRHQAEPKQPLMTKWYYMTRIAPCGAATSLDIGMGNMSLEFITLTFYSMSSSSSSRSFSLLSHFVFGRLANHVSSNV